MPRRDPFRVLVVEPDQGVREFLTDALSESADVTQVAGAVEAIRSLSRRSDGRSRFEVVIVDCGGVEPNTGRYRGVELVRLIASQEPSIAVVAMSAAAESEGIAAEAFRNGAREFLKKPFGVAELTTVIARVTVARQSGSSTRGRPPTLRSLM